MLNDQRMVTTLFIPHIDSCMEMITKNIFRPLPSIKKSSINISMSDTGVDSEENESDPTWPHIRGIYEIFLQLIVNEACDVRTVRTFINPNFISEVNNYNLNIFKKFFAFMIIFITLLY
jgi:hypothetical protein